LEGIDRWWSAFESHCETIDQYFTRGVAFDVSAFMDDHLKAISPELMWEFGRAKEKEGHRLVITPETERELRPLVRTLLQRAPALSRWEFYGHRLPEPDMVEVMIEARVRRKVEEVKGRALRGENHRIDVEFYLPSLSDVDERSHAAFVAAETLFGEELLDEWIGVVESTEALGSAEWLGVEDLAREARAILQTIRESLPDRPCHEVSEEADWSMIELRPSEADDYPDQADLFIAKTMVMEMWRTAHDGSPFSSSRFSRLGETFCYLKLDGKEGIEEEGFEDKSQIEDALDRSLAAEGLGCCIGGGTGWRYSYIDLALTDLPSAIQVIKRVLRAGRVPSRSWLLFFDDHWRDEWIGIWEDTPPPPRRSAPNGT
tara:strand:- start:1026 stop:2144 length:1119 start_codon:yes stop_codon:yes gene_type:complete